MHSLRRAIAAVTAGCLLVSGCYAYRPVMGGPSVGQRVRLRLTADGTAELARFLGPRVVAVDGDLVAKSDTAYNVGVDFVQTVDSIRQQWTGEGSVSIPSRFVTNVQQRTFLKRQTYVASALTVGLLIITAKIAINSGILGGDGGAGGAINP